jgi:uncharacterized RDD family membrane protein YckC
MSDALTPDTPPPDIPAPTFPPIAGFWPRIGAFAIDGFMLVVIGQLLGWTLSAFWFRMGPYGRFVGLGLALLYFGLMESRIGDGQTVGMRLLKLAVRDRNNQPLAIGPSMLRTLLWVLP